MGVAPPVRVILKYYRIMPCELFEVDYRYSATSLHEELDVDWLDVDGKSQRALRFLSCHREEAPDHSLIYSRKSLL